MSKGIINIYGDITSDLYFDSDMSAQRMSEKLEALGDVDEIVVNINSMGGSVAEGLSIYNQLKQHSAKITTVCNGFACSIASIIFLAGDERVMCNNSLLMVHNAWTMAMGNSKDLKKVSEELEIITQQSVNIYSEVTGLDEKVIKEMLDNETWIESNDALEMGFATVVYKDRDEAVSQSVKRTLIDRIKEKTEIQEHKEDNKEDKDVKVKQLDDDKDKTKIVVEEQLKNKPKNPYFKKEVS